MQDLIIVFSQNFDLYQNYINLNAANVPSDIRMLEWESEKSCHMRFQNNIAFVYFQHWITKLTNSKLFKNLILGVICPF